MLIGEAPGATEDQQGKPFVGDAGRELDSLLAAVGKTRADVRISNAVRCRPPQNRDPFPEEIAACFPYLAEEIETVKPKVIVCLGGNALKALTGKSSVAGERGRAVAPKKGMRTDATILVTYHPAAMLHGYQNRQKLRDAIKQDLELAFRIVDGGKQTDHRRALLIDGEYDAEKVKKALSALESCKVVAIDGEWTALTDRETTWPWSKGGEFYSLSITGRVGGRLLSVAMSFPLPPSGKEILQDFFDRHPVFGHNLMSDLIWLMSLGFRVRLAGDTLFLAHLLDEEQRLRLEQLAPLYAGVEIGWKEPPRDCRPFNREGWVKLLNYNSDDTYATFKLIEALYGELGKREAQERDGIRRIYTKLLLRALPVFVKMALAGTPMNPEKVTAELAQSKERLADIVGSIASIAGLTPRQAAALAGSPQQSTRYLRDAYGLEIDGSAADELIGFEHYPAVPLIQQYRWERNKLQGTYFGPWLKLLEEQRDRRLHSVYRLATSRTGRTGAELGIGGALQLAPRASYVRGTVEVDDPDEYDLLVADYSQIELRVIAWLAPERRMREFYNESLDNDLHKATAGYLKALRINPRISAEDYWRERKKWMDAVTKEERQRAKGVNFGFDFGMQADSFVTYAKKNYGVDFTLEEAAEARSGYFRLWDDLDRWHRRCQEVDMVRGYTVTPFGRYRRNLTEVTKAINTPIQATATDLTVFSMTAIDERAAAERVPPKLFQLVGFVHDSVLAVSHRSYTDEAKQLIKHEMEHPDLRPLGVSSIPVPLKADVVVGKNWAEAS